MVVIVVGAAGTTPTMERRKRWGRGVSYRHGRILVAGFPVGLVASSCEYADADVFNARAAELVCEIYDKCGEDITTSIDLGDSELDRACYDTVRDDFDVCDDNCAFNAGKARRCIRRLERMADDCDVASLGPCRRVYDECEAPATGDGACELWNCSVAPGPSRWSGGWIALGLLMLGAVGRRRRRTPTKPQR